MRADGHFRGLVGEQIDFAEELAFGQQRDAQVAAVYALAEHLDLALGDDEELVAVLAFDDQLVAQRDRFRLEAFAHAGEDRIGQSREQRHASQRFRGELGAVRRKDSMPIRAALVNSTLVRLTRYVPPSTCTHGSSFNSHRGVIDIIFGDVLVVLARLRATEVVTLRCRILSDMVVLLLYLSRGLMSDQMPSPCSKPRASRLA